MPIKRKKRVLRIEPKQKQSQKQVVNIHIDKSSNFTKPRRRVPSGYISKNIMKSTMDLLLQKTAPQIPAMPFYKTQEPLYHHINPSINIEGKHSPSPLLHVPNPLLHTPPKHNKELNISTTKEFYSPIQNHSNHHSTVEKILQQANRKALFDNDKNNDEVELYDLTKRFVESNIEPSGTPKASRIPRIKKPNKDENFEYYY
jgi:hypothetical protein